MRFVVCLNELRCLGLNHDRLLYDLIPQRFQLAEISSSMGSRTKIHIQPNVKAIPSQFAHADSAVSVVRFKVPTAAAANKGEAKIVTNAAMGRAAQRKYIDSNTQA